VSPGGVAAIPAYSGINSYEQATGCAAALCIRPETAAPRCIIAGRRLQQSHAEVREALLERPVVPAQLLTVLPEQPAGAGEVRGVAPKRMSVGRLSAEQEPEESTAHDSVW
jgi:hypothetical protein